VLLILLVALFTEPAYGLEEPRRSSLRLETNLDAKSSNWTWKFWVSPNGAAGEASRDLEDYRGTICCF